MSQYGHPSYGGSGEDALLRRTLLLVGQSETGCLSGLPLGLRLEQANLARAVISLPCHSPQRQSKPVREAIGKFLEELSTEGEEAASIDGQ
jgi:hypothetical protein